MEINMRKVQWYIYEQANGKYYDKVYKGDALFHQWGIDYEEFETGLGNFSTAIIELPDGTVKNIPADMIVFI